MRLRGGGGVGVERHVLSFPRFPAALLDCCTRHLYVSCFVVQLLGNLYENETYEGVCGRRSLSKVVLYENVNEVLYWVWFAPKRLIMSQPTMRQMCIHVRERTTCRFLRDQHHKHWHRSTPQALTQINTTSTDTDKYDERSMPVPCRRTLNFLGSELLRLASWIHSAIVIFCDRMASDTVKEEIFVGNLIS